MPDPMYGILPCTHDRCASWRAFRNSPKPEAKQDAFGRIVYEREPQQDADGTFEIRPLLDFKILPDRVR